MNKGIAIGRKKTIYRLLFTSYCLLFTLYCLSGCAASQKNRYIQKKDNIIHDEARILIDEEEEKKKRAELLFNSGFQLLNNDPMSAASIYSEVIEIMPDKWEAHYNLGVSYMRLNNLEKAKEEFYTALKYKAPPAAIYNAIGIVYLSMGKNSDAISNFKKAVSSEKSPKIMMNIANVHQNMGQADEAIKYYRQIEGGDTSNLPFHHNMGVLKYKGGDFKNAKYEFEKALAEESENAETLIYQAQTLLKLRDYESALSLYQKAAAKNPSDPIPYKNMGIIYEVYSGDMEKALENYNAYIKNGGEKTKEIEGWIEVVKARMAKK